MEGLDKIISFIFGDISGRVTALIVGVIATSVVYSELILVEKDTQLDSKQQLILVKEERIKSVNDQINVLKSQLIYKPYKDKKDFEDLQQINTSLEKENLRLSQLVSELQKVGDNVNAEELVASLSEIKQENLQLKNELSLYTSEIVIKDQRIDLGKAWSGFGGVVVFGVDEISVLGYSKTRLSVNGNTTTMETNAGDQYVFTVGENEYLLNILSVEYVSSRVSISVSKKI
ncbi:hypothetical protein [Vibrio genomosp. F6]|uniref:Uncharacterized protein n=1 Tax=Vibrio genomosp. F6 str. FF-238 TaxID=1191298 RepID=A0A1E5CQM8_9VIBR|nr:hypothetical protein [Vibrio genomosp. F6]OEE72198.1 hypothetical protein A130_07445 [Vibrio genomosp. F6 str. FF-238]